MRTLTVATTVLALAACGDNQDASPFGPLPLDGSFTVGLDDVVHVARDEFGVAHIKARNLRDAAFVQGYVMAHDRLPQMDILRRFGAGTLSELAGSLDPSVIDSDLEMRVHRMKPLATATFETLKASTDPTDVQIVDLLNRFADGVNAYAADLADGDWTIDPQLALTFLPATFAPWTPVDSLVLGRFQAFSLSFTTPFEIDITDLYQRLDTFYDKSTAATPERFARRGVSRDLMTFTPVGADPTIDGFPNVAADTGTRSDGSARAKPGKRGRTAAAAAAPPAPTRPQVPAQLFDRARTFFTSNIFNGPFGALGPHAFMRPYSGSNNWAISPALTGDGSAILGSDQHLQLPNPSIFYPTHLIVDDPANPLDVLGITFPGIPGVILGSNGDVAWAATVTVHDVNDVYLETIAPCGAADCVAFEGRQVPIERFEEVIRIGALGSINETRTVTYELVPHHGPIIPTIADHDVVPRTGNQALSVKYTGYEPTFEIRALFNLARAKNIEQGFRALADFSFGSQNWTMIDNTGPSIGWTTNSVVPDRSPATYQWHPVTNPTGAAPFFVLDGKGGFEWQGRMDSRYVPHAIDPAQGYLATANADPVGATFDNDALNQTVVDGRPLYVGAAYAAGVREERITTLIKAGAPTVDATARIQHDTSSTMGAKLTPPLLAALALLDTTAGAPADAIAFVAGLPAGDRATLTTARGLLAGWTFATPPAIAAPDPDSAATALFNTWMHFFIVRALRDEFTPLPGATPFDVFGLADNQLARIVFAMLTRPATFVQLASTGQPVLCDDFASAGDDSCSKVILQAVLDAMAHLASPQGFATADTAEWRWGRLHKLTIRPLFPNPALNLPAPGETTTDGFPKPGDNFNVNRSDMGWRDLNFSQFADGPAQRFIARAAGANAEITVRWALPGGVIFDSRSTHYRDLLDKYYLAEQHFDAPYTVPQIVDHGETRWEFR